MRLKVALVMVLVALSTVGFSTNASNAKVAAAHAERVVTKSPTPAAAPSTQLTTNVSSATQQVLDHLAQRQANRGCGISLIPATPKRKVGECTVLLVGDSMGNNLGSGLMYQLERTKGINFIKRSKGSTGLSNSWFYDWPAILKPMLGRYKPNLVIVMLGANDRQNMKVGGSTLSFGTSAWKQAYRDQIDRITAMITKAGSYTLWVGLPVMEPKSYGEGMAELNKLYSTQAPLTPGVTFLDVWSYLADDRGQYRDRVRVNNTFTNIRGGDGIHFSMSGMRVLASYVLLHIRETYSVNVRPRQELPITG